MQESVANVLVKAYSAEAVKLVLIRSEEALEGFLSAGLETRWDSVCCWDSGEVSQSCQFAGVCSWKTVSVRLDSFNEQRTKRHHGKAVSFHRVWG